MQRACERTKQLPDQTVPSLSRLMPLGKANSGGTPRNGGVALANQTVRKVRTTGGLNINYSQRVWRKYILTASDVDITPELTRVSSMGG